MKKGMKKTFLAMIIVATLFLSTTSVFASVSNTNEVVSIQLQTKNLIEEVDVKSLLNDAKNNVIDHSVPNSVREKIAFSVDFKPSFGVSKDAIKLKMGSTVKKIGEILNKNGEKSNMYVAVVTATEDTKMDYNQEYKYGIEATAFVYWIDNYGMENELYAVKAQWETYDVEVTNRRITYGACNLLGWTDTPTTEFVYSNTKKIYNSSYTGFMLRCETRIDVVNLGTVTCTATSSALTR